MRSGDGTIVYAPSESPYGTGMYRYDVSSKTLSTINQGSAVTPLVAVNRDGSKLVLSAPVGGSPYYPMALYDASLNFLGTLPGQQTGFGPNNLFVGGLLFSADGSKIYVIGQYDNLPLVLTIDGSTLQVLHTAPTSDTGGVKGMTITPTPFAVDSTGLILGIQMYGISFEDSTFYQTYATNQLAYGTGGPITAPCASPLEGGGSSNLYSFPPLIPDVWFGQTRGTVNISQQLNFTAPPSNTPGPVNLKFIYPDGEQTLYPSLCSYSTFLETPFFSASAPSGGAPSQVIGFGLPQDSSGGTVMVGANTATITSTVGQYPPFTNELVPSTYLNYTFPPGTSGWADLQVTTPAGTGTLPKSILYAKSVIDYPSADTFTAVLVDEKRQQLYLAAGDHIDVFSTSSNQYLAPLHPKIIGTQSQFSGLALTPDGSQLLATNLLDDSLAVINPDSPSGTFAIPLPTPAPVNTCAVGPLYVAASANNLAFITSGSFPYPAARP
jgi:hypothetical protein